MNNEFDNSRHNSTNYLLLLLLLQMMINWIEEDNNKDKINEAEREAAKQLLSLMAEGAFGKTSLRIDTITADLGFRCIKTLRNMQVDQNPNITDEEKEMIKREINDYIDIIKEYVKNQLKKEGRLI